MFYSQTYLARKGPLGTVWCAAHLQHRLKKSHYTATDISITVDRIMFPEVPIALRMSGHLLLGVVRIYSKKVDYLFQDCTVVLNGLRKAFASIDLNLPEDARQAPVQAITLPDTFDLDALDLDDVIYHDGAHDNHLRSLEEITLTDQIPIGIDPYVAISFDEDIIMMDLSHPEVVPDSDVRAKEDISLPHPMTNDGGFRDPGPINQSEVFNARISNDNTPQNFPHDEGFLDPGCPSPTEMSDTRLSNDNLSPEVERIRNAARDFGLENPNAASDFVKENLPQVHPDCGDDIAEPDRSSNEFMNGKNEYSPIVDINLPSGGQSQPFQQHSELPASTASQEDHENIDVHFTLGPINQSEVLNARISNDNTQQNFPHDEGFLDPGCPSPTEMSDTRLSNDNLSPEVERIRNAACDFGLENPNAASDFVKEIIPQVHPYCGDDIAEPDRTSDQFMNEKNDYSPTVDVNLPSGGQSQPFQQRSELPASTASQEDHENIDVHFSLGPLGLEILQPTPPVQQPKRRQRKRKQFFDESTVLTNKYMKQSLEDSSVLLRKRRDIPSSTLDVWKLNNSLRKEQVFLQPSITGLCMDLCDIFKKDCISMKPHLVEAFPDPRLAASPTPTTEALPEPGIAQSPAPTTEAVPEPSIAQSPAFLPDHDMEIEGLRNVKGYDDSNFVTEIVSSPPKFMPSLRKDDFTPATTIETEVFPTPDPAVSAETYRFELGTPVVFSKERLGLENSGISDIPELMNSAEAEDLYFLEADNNTPTGSQGTGVDSLSVRTRAVAQYLKKHSPMTPTSEDLSGDLSLNKILEGKTRKLCARMFFETLVLKNYGLVDVQQEEPYGDISLKLTPTLSKAQI